MILIIIIIIVVIIIIIVWGIEQTVSFLVLVFRRQTPNCFLTLIPFVLLGPVEGLRSLSFVKAGSWNNYIYLFIYFVHQLFSFCCSKTQTYVGYIFCYYNYLLYIN